MSTLRMGFDSMSAWNKSAFDMDANPCRPLKHHSTPAVPTLRRKPIAARQVSVPVNTPYHSIERVDSPMSATLSPHAPTFSQAKSHWSPPPSPRTRSLKMATSSSSSVASERQDSPVTTPTISPQDQSALAKNLYAAACAGDTKHIRLLLSLGAPINTPTMVEGLYDVFKPAKPGPLSALAGATGNGQLSAARLLLAHGAAINPTMKQSSSSPLHQACKADDREMAAFLLEHGADVDSDNCFKSTPLMYAAKHGSPALVHLLLAYQPNIHKLSFIGTAAIHWALWPGNETVMELLLQAGTDLDLALGDGSTLLHCAALADDVKVAKMLLRFGANPLKRNEEWKTPLQVASERANWSIAAVLRDAEAMQ